MVQNGIGNGSMSGLGGPEQPAGLLGGPSLPSAPGSSVGHLGSHVSHSPGTPGPVTQTLSNQVPENHS